MKKEEEERHRRKMEEDRIAQEEMQRQLVEMQRVSQLLLIDDAIVDKDIYKTLAFFIFIKVMDKCHYT